MTAALSLTQTAREPALIARRTAWWPLALVALGALGLAVGLAILDAAAPVGVAADDAMYVILAKSLAEGEGYRFLNLPGAPVATHFPPGYPVLLALLWKLSPSFPANVVLFKAFNACCLAVVAAGTARYLRLRVGGAGWAAAAGVVTAVSVPLLVLETMLLSELFFLALLVFLLPALERFVDSPASTRRALWLGVFIGLLMLVRTHAIVLVPATAMVLLLRRRWRDAAVVTVAALALLLPWQIWSAHYGGALPAPLLGEYDSYTAWWMRGLDRWGWRMIPVTLARTLPEAGGMFASLFSPARHAVARIVTLVALGALVLLAARVQWRRLGVTLLFVTGYLAIVAIWPFPPGRFIWGIWPILLLLLVTGAREAASALAVEFGLVGHAAGGPQWRRASSLLMAAAALWLAAGYTAYEVRAVRGQWWRSIPRNATARIVPAIEWTLANTAPGDLITTDDDGALFLYTGRRTLPNISFTTEQYIGRRTTASDAAEGLIPLLQTYPVSVVLVGTPATWTVAMSLTSQPAPLLALREPFPNGAAFTVLPR